MVTEDPQAGGWGLGSGSLVLRLSSKRIGGAAFCTGDCRVLVWCQREYGQRQCNRALTTRILEATDAYVGKLELLLDSCCTPAWRA